MPFGFFLSQYRSLGQRVRSRAFELERDRALSVIEPTIAQASQGVAAQARDTGGFIGNLFRRLQAEGSSRAAVSLQEGERRQGREQLFRAAALPLPEPAPRFSGREFAGVEPIIPDIRPGVLPPGPFQAEQVRQRAAGPNLLEFGISDPTGVEPRVDVRGEPIPFGETRLQQDETVAQTAERRGGADPEIQRLRRLLDDPTLDDGDRDFIENIIANKLLQVRGELAEELEPAPGASRLFLDPIRKVERELQPLGDIAAGAIRAGGEQFARGRGVPVEAPASEALAGARGEELRELGREIPVLPELLNPINFVPIPILDAVFAKVLGTAFVRLLTKTGRSTTRAEARELLTAARSAIRSGKGGTEAVAFADELAENLARSVGPQAPTTAAVPERAPPGIERPPSRAPVERGAAGVPPSGRAPEAPAPPARAPEAPAVPERVTAAEVPPVRAVADEPEAQLLRELDAEEAAGLEARAVGGGALPAKGPAGQVLPERGVIGAQEVLRLKEETLRKPGVLTQMPGIKQIASKLNRSITLDRNVFVSFNADQAVRASLETEFAAKRLPVVQRLLNAFDAQPPRYTGPSKNTIKDTLKDFADNPDFYTDVSSELSDAAQAYNAVSDEILARVRGRYGVNVSAFVSEKEGAFYLPTVKARETLDEAMLNVAEGYTSSGVPTKTGVTKRRVYDGAFQRQQNNPGFVAETDLAELTALHDAALAKLAGNETFRLGAGGRTRLDIMKELKPDLFNRMIGLRRKLANLRGTAGRLNTRMRDAIDDFLVDPDGNLSDLADTLDVTVKQKRLDVPVSPAKIRGVSQEVDVLRRQATVRRGQFKGEGIETINAEIKSVRQEIRQLRPAWEAANLEPFVLNRTTFRYHTAEQSVAIDKLFRTKLNMGDGLLRAIDEVRLFAFAGDVSPLTIQGLLGILSDPFTGALSLRGAGRALLTPDSLLEIAAREPLLIRRFTLAEGRPFGQLSAEFVQARRGIERIPVVGPELNRRLMAAVELIRYNQWKTDTKLAQLGGKTQNVADAEASNALSKIIPALNPAERGVSVLQARVERVPFISTSFIGGPATAMKDAASGLAKLTFSRALSPAARWQELAGREQLAILHLSSIAGTIVTASISTHILSGWSPEDAVKTVLDPNSPRFLSIALGPKRRIPLGGPLRSAVRAFVPQKVGEVEGVPIYVPFLGTKQWIENKITPAINAPIDIARNADYFGGKIATGSFPENMLRMIWFGVNNALPLAIQEPSEAIRRKEVEPTDIGRLAELSGAQFAGIDLRETSRFEEFRFAFKEEFGVDYDGTEGHRTIAKAKPRLRDMLAEVDRTGAEQGFPGAVKRQEREQTIAGLAEDLSSSVEGVRTGNADAGAAFRDDYSDFKTQRAGVFQRDFFGVEFPEPESEAGKALDRLGEMNPKELPYRNTDPETGDFATDWDLWFADQERELDIIDKDFPGYKEYHKTRTFLPEEMQDVERQFIATRDLRNQLGEIPQFNGLSVSEHDYIKSFLRWVEEERNLHLEESGRQPPLQAAIRAWAEQFGATETDVAWAITLGSSKKRDANRNPDYDQFIIDNRVELELFYPEVITDRIRARR